jgi:rRNA maturation protein Nop10
MNGPDKMCGKCGSKNVKTIWQRFGPDNEAEPAWLKCKDCGAKTEI